MKKNSTPQRQFKKGYVPHESVQPNSVENREAASPSKKRMGIQIGSGAQARPGLQGMQSRNQTPSGTLKKRGK